MAVVTGYRGIKGYATPATKGDKGVVCIQSQASAHALVWGTWVQSISRHN